MTVNAQTAPPNARPGAELTRRVRWLLCAQRVMVPVALVSGAMACQVLGEFQAGICHPEAAVEAGEASDARQ